MTSEAAKAALEESQKARERAAAQRMEAERGLAEVHDIVQSLRLQHGTESVSAPTGPQWVTSHQPL
jgi:hypothetical protein